MYAREYPSHGGMVKAFEDAYAKEAFLKRSAENNTPTEKCVQKIASYDKTDICTVNKEEQSICEEKSETGVNNYTAKQKKGFAGIFNGTDSGDLILLLLIVFFLFDSDKEKDSVIPILLAVLLLF